MNWRHRVLDRRTADCTADSHSLWARRYTGCTCPPTDRDRANRRDRSRARATGPAKVNISRDRHVDPIAVERLIGGDTPARVSSADRAAAVRILTARGMTAAAIGRRLRCNARTVGRYRSADRARLEATSC